MFDWSRAQPRAALLCLPAIALPLALGIGLGRTRAGMMCAAGAFSVGFGSFQQLRQSRRLPMLVAAAGICLSSWIGTWGGLSPGVAIALAGVWGAAAGAAAVTSPGASWLALQCLIWLVISTAYPAHGQAALLRGSCALAGGLFQMLVVWTGWWLGGRIPPAASTPLTPMENLARVRTWRAIHSGLILVISVALAHTVRLGNSYWIPMTAAIVTRPAFRQTVERGLARTVGTMAGAAIATLATSALHPRLLVLSVLVLVFAAGGYLLLFVNYAAFAASITAYVVFLLSMAGAPERTLVEHRLLSTLMGAALAWLGHALFHRAEQALITPGAPQDAAEAL